MAIYENSRYIQTPIYKRLDLNTYMLKRRERPTYNLLNCKIHEWTVGDTLDGLAYKYYGICALRWAILDANPKYKTEYEIEAGDLLYIPNYREVVSKVQ